jgi:maleylacetate reductase
MNPAEFVYASPAARVVFGPGSLRHLGRELDLLGVERALVLCTPQQRAHAEEVAAALGTRSVGVYDKARMHVPAEVVREAIDAAERCHADCAVALGGGSTTGLAKAVALRSGLPLLAVPTTYAGSEMTPIYGITEGGLKTTGKDPRVLPRTVIYDPLLTLGLPVALSVCSGINAIAHAAEGLYARDANPIMSLMAEEGIRALAGALPRVVAAPRDVDARSDALYGAWLCGTVLGNVGMALHHKLCHTLGGSFDLPHAETHTVVLPHAIAYNAPADPRAAQRIARALGCADAGAGLFALARDHGAPTSLRELGLREDQLDDAADIAVRSPYWNPRSVDRPQIRALLQRAWLGLAPEESAPERV